MSPSQQQDRRYAVKTDSIGFVSTQKEDYVARWKELRDDAGLMMLTAAPMPPRPQEDIELSWGMVAARKRLLFDIVLLEDGRCIGEADLYDIRWPHGSAHVGIVLFDDDDTHRGYGSDACRMLVAYAFDGLGLRRVSLEFLASNVGLRRLIEAGGGKVIGIAREAVWAYGAHRDYVMMDALRDEVEPHPSTAHLREVPAAHLASTPPPG